MPVSSHVSENTDPSQTESSTRGLGWYPRPTSLLFRHITFSRLLLQIWVKRSTILPSLTGSGLGKNFPRALLFHDCFLEHLREFEYLGLKMLLMFIPMLNLSSHLLFISNKRVSKLHSACLPEHLELRAGQMHSFYCAHFKLWIYGDLSCNASGVSS